MTKTFSFCLSLFLTLFILVAFTISYYVVKVCWDQYVRKILSYVITKLKGGKKKRLAFLNICDFVEPVNLKIFFISVKTNTAYRIVS